MRENVRKLGLHYPVALDNGFGTWKAWHNQYWPAKYLIDRNGARPLLPFRRRASTGRRRSAIRTLLGEATPRAASGLADDSPHGVLTPESYLGYKRLGQQRGRHRREGRTARLHLSARDLLGNELAYGGRWTVEGERAVAGRAQACGCSTAPATSTSC